MIIQTPKEHKRLRKSGEAVRTALETMARAAKPGVSTAELNRIGAKVLAEYSSKSAPPRVYNFPGDVCISINNEALHGIPSEKRILQNGDLLKLDVVAERDRVYTDAAITVIVGEGTETDKRLICCAQEAFYEGMMVARPGAPTNDIGRVVEAVTTRWGFTVLEGFGGHGVGKTIHEPPFVPNHYLENCTDILQEGMVITIEPLVCEKGGAHSKLEDGWTIVTNDGGRVAHYEHTLIIEKDVAVIVT